MSVLQRGVRFPHRFRSGAWLQDRLQWSEGSAPASRAAAVRYRPTAIVPNEAWHRLDDGDIAALTADDNHSELAADIELVVASDRLMRLAASSFAGIDDRHTEGGGACSLAAPHHGPLLDAIAALAGDWGRVARPPMIRISRPGLPTVTAENGAHIGLHIDSWYARERRQGACSPGRISFNLGQQPRHLLLVNLTQQQMFERLLSVGAVERHSSLVGTPLGLSFLQRFPHYPVLKLRVDPGEAYVAPTENLLHDGCSMGMTSWDIAAHVLGRFAVHSVAAAIRPAEAGR
jgi:hypothetical protein